jgi:hypothetical protein
MKKVLIFLSLMLVSCSDYSKRMDTVQKKYPKCVVLPSLPTISGNSYYHYDVIVRDTIAKQMYGIEFYSFSDQRIYNIDLLLYYNLEK